MPDPLPQPPPGTPNLSPDLGERYDVNALHAALTREKPEPREGFEPVSLWLVALTGVLLFWGGYYLANFAGRFEADEYSEVPRGIPVAGSAVDETPEQKLARIGAQVYNANCAACHQNNGEGVSGQFPPLANSDWVNVDGNNRLIRIVLNGLGGPIIVNGAAYNNQMNQFHDILGDLEIAAVLTYVRGAWGNKGGLVTEEEVAALRDEAVTRAAYTAEELLALPLKGGAGSAAAPAAEGALSLEQLQEALKALPADQLKTLLQEMSAP